MGSIPVAREGWPFILVSLALTAAAFAAGFFWPGVVLGLAAVFVTAFFRDPEREVPDDDNAILSPADGKVIKLDRVEENRFFPGPALKVSVFMTVFNVHVNRAPATGKVIDIRYNPGRFLSANLDKASLENEQNAVIMETPAGRRFVFNQIAGLVARRIVCRARVGGELTMGERFGLIRFGSRLDVYLPTGCRPVVGIGDKVRAGSSILAYWK